MTEIRRKPLLTLIAAVTRNGVIGRSGDMPFHIPSDLRHFKSVTMGKPIVMGRRTFESLPGGALPGRRNVVVTRSRGWTAPDAETAPSIAEALELCRDSEEVMICGGGEIYAQTIEMATRLIITEIDAEVVDGDTFFPAIDPLRWHVTESSELVTDQRSGLNLRFITYTRY